tara:strand:- start:186 stop:812 length:627 start_codon:yes stop_codon:yes gene_type:complete
MTSISTTQKTSKRSLTFNKSFLLSIFIHLIIIFGITLTTFYKLPILKDSPVINVRFANSNEDYLGSMSNSMDSIINYSQSEQEMFETEIQKGNFQNFKVKKLEANSYVNSDEAIYLNIWQRKIESIGDRIIQANRESFEGTVQIMATIDETGNLIKSDILISSGNKIIDNMAIKILNESAPFEPFNDEMKSEYTFIEIVRDWNFSTSS